ncbi:hypothetical protein NDU88_005555 [Pleurodeles waltl]|uniref:Uncharacterized protein n=1 Tax=Pleurodeles waltl TaxID=8319 RepID=A0AAV7W8E1_PLEWA|nr:hypothetical protein NDU88_005555 [Pleurodeles waltl]
MRLIVEPDQWDGRSGVLEGVGDQELAQQEDALSVLQRQIDNGDTLEAGSRVVRGRIGALWSRLDSYVRKDFRQRLHREGEIWAFARLAAPT